MLVSGRFNHIPIPSCDHQHEPETEQRCERLRLQPVLLDPEGVGVEKARSVV